MVRQWDVSGFWYDSKSERLKWSEGTYALKWEKKLYPKDIICKLTVCKLTKCGINAEIGQTVKINKIWDRCQGLQ